MRKISLALLIFCISPTAQQAPTELPKCESLSQILTLASCIPMVNELKDYPQELAVNQCQESDMLKKKLEESCEILYYLGDQFHCLTGFFKEAYSSNGSACFQKYDFVEKILSKKRKAFEKGESCFTDYKFVTDISTKPDGTNCQNTHNQLNRFQYNVIDEQIPDALQELHNIKLKPNDTRVTKLIKMCKDMHYCMADSCYIPQQTNDTVERSCMLLEMIDNGSFTSCASKLMKEKPDLSNYECLEGLDFYETL
ncbi:unnamed protein product [Caenorhabditis nigoni]